MLLIIHLKLMPLLLRGLDLPDMEIRANVINTLVSVVGAEPTEQNTISEHASTLVSTMLRNSMASEMSSMVRLIVDCKCQSVNCVTLAGPGRSIAIFEYAA
jgi:hypothetical protein